MTIFNQPQKGVGGEGCGGAISSSSLNRCDYICGQSGGAKQGRRQEVTVSEIRGGKIMTSGKTEVD